MTWFCVAVLALSMANNGAVLWIVDRQQSRLEPVLSAMLEELRRRR